MNRMPGELLTKRPIVPLQFRIWVVTWRNDYVAPRRPPSPRKQETSLLGQRRPHFPTRQLRRLRQHGHNSPLACTQNHQQHKKSITNRTYPCHVGSRTQRHPKNGIAHPLATRTWLKHGLTDQKRLSSPKRHRVHGT